MSSKLTSTMHQLDAMTVSKLRSGTVITGLPQCIMELITNSLDAIATRIQVHIDAKNCRITVSDNGIGIPRDDLLLLGRRYVTSKLHSMSDLSNLNTYGFRGEALASISSIGCLKIISRHSSNIGGRAHMLVIQSGRSISHGDATPAAADMLGSGTGTQVAAYDLFGCMPVRQQLLRLNQQLIIIKRQIVSLALIHPHVVFAVYNDECTSKILHTRVCQPTNGISVGTFSQVFGTAKANTLELVQYTDGCIGVNGLAAVTGHHTNSLQFLYVNRRPVIKTRLHKALCAHLGEALVCCEFDYGTRGISRSHPVYVLNITCPASEVDVFLEPAKTMVEFSNWSTVLRCLHDAIADFLTRCGLPSPGLHQRMLQGITSNSNTSKDNYNHMQISPSSSTTPCVDYRNVKLASDNMMSPMTSENYNNSSNFREFLRKFSPSFNSVDYAIRSTHVGRPYSELLGSPASITPPIEPELKNSSSSCVSHEARDELSHDFGTLSSWKTSINNSPSASHTSEWTTFEDSINGTIYIHSRTGNTSILPPPDLIESPVSSAYEKSNSTTVADELITFRWHDENLSRKSTTLSPLSDVCDKNVSKVSHRKGKDVNSALFGGDKIIDGINARWKNPALCARTHKIHVLSLPLAPSISSNIHSTENVPLSRRVLATPMSHRFSKIDLKKLKVIAQVDRKFIACLAHTNIDSTTSRASSCPRMLVFIDQHAAHERVRTEALWRLLRNDNDKTEGTKSEIASKEITPLLIPASKLCAIDLSVLGKYRSEFRRIGLYYTIETSVHEHQVVFNSVPSILLGNGLDDVNLDDCLDASVDNPQIKWRKCNERILNKKEKRDTLMRLVIRLVHELIELLEAAQESISLVIIGPATRVLRARSAYIARSSGLINHHCGILFASTGRAYNNKGYTFLRK